MTSTSPLSLAERMDDPPTSLPLSERISERHSSDEEDEGPPVPVTISLPPSPNLSAVDTNSPTPSAPADDEPVNSDLDLAEFGDSFWHSRRIHAVQS